MCEILVDLLDVNITGAEGGHRQPVSVHFECRRVDVGCPECGVLARVKDRDRVSLVDLPMNGRPTRVVWHKRRFFCPDAECTRALRNHQELVIRWLRKQRDEVRRFNHKLRSGRKSLL